MMIAARSPFQSGSPVPPAAVRSGVPVGCDLADSELTPAELSRLFAEVDSLQLASLMASSSRDGASSVRMG